MLFFRAILATTLLMGLLVSACAPSVTDLPIPVSGGSAEPQFADFDPGNFSDSANIDNAWMPMRPGTKWVYEGKALDDEGKTIKRRIEFTVTDLTKVIAGVRTVVAWIEDFDDGEVIEKEIAFYAQDDDGNVWYLGEHPEEIDNGKFVAAPTWIVGIAEARAGVKMWAEPKLGGPVVYQGWGPAVEWSDYGRVDQVGQETCVAVDCYTDVLVNAESSLGEEGAYQLKYYARGVGEVRVGWKGVDTVQEELELVELATLTPAELEAVRAEAIDLEKHAYEISDVYRQTPPSEYPFGEPVLQVEVGQTPPTVSAPPQGSALDIVVYASDLPQSALTELEFIDDTASPGGTLIGLPNNGDELDPPPENDPHVTFTVQVQSGVPYRCWVHMKVGTPKGRSTANVVWVQASNAVDDAGREVLQPGSDSYLTAEGPSQPGWTWVECDWVGSEAEPLIIFSVNGEVTIRIQAGAEGVGFDQFVLSADRYLDAPPSGPIVEK